MMMPTVTEDNFNQEVLASSTPVLVHFRAPWCGICRLISPLLDRYRDEWPGQLHLYEVNADENFKLANQYRLTTLPTLLYIENGEVLHRIEGFKNREGFRDRLEDIAWRYRLKDTFTDSPVTESLRPRA